MFAVDKSFDRNYLLYDVELETARFRLKRFPQIFSSIFWRAANTGSPAQKLVPLFGQCPFWGGGESKR